MHCFVRVETRHRIIDVAVPKSLQRLHLWMQSTGAKPYCGLSDEPSWHKIPTWKKSAGWAPVSIRGAVVQRSADLSRSAAEAARCCTSYAA